MNTIRLRGIKVHNLKNIDVEIPRNQLVVITGVSGSGKSSLAFDTIYAEGQRRYIESLSTYARQFLDRMDKPDIESIEGICPAIAIEQKNQVRSARSTIGTTTEIYDYLRLLFARIGTNYCSRCGAVVQQDSIDSILDELSDMPEGTKFLVGFPFAVQDAVEQKKGPADDPTEQRDRFRQCLLQKGFLRVVVDGEIVSLDDESFHLSNEKQLLVVVDRLMMRPALRERLTDALEIAYQEGHGRLSIMTFGRSGDTHTESSPENTRQVRRFSRKFECSQCEIASTAPEPRLFSFNNPYGACPECKGFGDTMNWDMNLIIPDRTKSIREGAIAPWTTPRSAGIITQLERIAPQHGFTLDTAIQDLSERQFSVLLKGDADFIGILPFFDYLEEKKYKMHIRVFMSKFRGYQPCPLCKGSRLNAAARLVKVGGKSIHELSCMTIADAKQFFDTLDLSDFEQRIAEKALEQVHKRLQYLLDVGLSYLTLNRLSRTLSGGEMQRIHLASSLGSSLVNSLYVLDEPSIGLHPRDNSRLIGILKMLRDTGNTVLVVEHDADMIRESNYVIDLGPQAGEHGGEIVFAGRSSELLKLSSQNNASLTGQYLRAEKRIPLPESRRAAAAKLLSLKNACEHNLKTISVDFPLERFICITGVSGSGKSTLIQNILYKALKHERLPGNGYSELVGQEALADVVMVDQSPVGRSPRSNPVTYMKAFDEIRKLFASVRLARERAYTAASFSFNMAGGRCETCKGSGRIQVEMQFLADLYLTCDTCHGTRYKRDVLDVRYRRLTIHDVLNLTVSEAARFFHDAPRFVHKMQVLCDVGLGYLRLGQAATTLSGGEAQRLKLASHLANTRKKHILYLFDEPTTGLHVDDIATLLACFRQLVERGHTLIVIEHNLDVIKCADYIIDLGPEGGDNGGEIVACGTPEEIARAEQSCTGTYLRDYITRHHGMMYKEKET
ncbi:excinuclease ABC subunit A [candidate division KSB3 bacterium]|uniref:UvrABC system protein A n=1 Tax=candidate division KSB3 bacterium TaxID=2044937 RepID=A0A2G6E4A8_9BACT|nr:MAG: excinuclease ABC subunit A [candidate division KSB3 bacterium]PIE29422.1 MAG: excinuclease ABC subunit A [candidate division KSB3 bacterium]